MLSLNTCSICRVGRPSTVNVNKDVTLIGNCPSHAPSGAVFVPARRISQREIAWQAGLNHCNFPSRWLNQ